MEPKTDLMVRVRNAIANQVMCELLDYTHKLVEKYGVDISIAILQWQIELAKDLEKNQVADTE